jgi:fibronectin type 3 domain-containing protein
MLLVVMTIAVSAMLSSCAPQLAGGTGSGNSSSSNSTALNSPTAPSRTSVGTPHDVTLNWNASISSGIMGYNVYRGTGSGGPYLKLNSGTIVTTSYTDTVQSGQTYYYVVTAMNSGSQESVYSNEVAATIP